MLPQLHYPLITVKSNGASNRGTDGKTEDEDINEEFPDINEILLEPKTVYNLIRRRTTIANVRICCS